MLLTIPAIVMIAGVLMYALCASQKLQNIGLVMFAVGLLCVLIDMPAVFHVLPVRP